jgi:hypothetical protein
MWDCDEISIIQFTQVIDGKSAHSVGGPTLKGRRRGLSVLRVLSAMLLVAGMSLLTVLLWIRSIWQWDYFDCQIPHMTSVFHADSLRNRLNFWVQPFSKPRADVWMSYHSCGSPSWGNALDIDDSWANNLVIIAFDKPRREVESDGIRFPHWILAMLFAFVPFVRYMARRRGRSPLRGHCGRCGYNLTGNVSGTCPECGAACKSASRAGESLAAENLTICLRSDVQRSAKGLTG